MDFKAKIRSSIIAGIIGDALGVPVEYSTSRELSLCSVKNMLGYGRYDQPEGTWSDDTALSLCTIESLCKGYDLEDIARTFCRWLFSSHLTANGHVFDCGIVTYVALENFRSGKDARKSGCAGEEDNGNGSLMRILPAALYFMKKDIDEFLAAVHEISAITHAHPRSMMACGIYSLLIKNLFSENPKEKAFAQTVEKAGRYYKSQKPFKNEIEHFDRILSGDIVSCKAAQINTTGYVVDTLEAALWSFMNHTTTRDIVLASVNSGLDTDTSGILAGGLAGAEYGLESIPEEWIDCLARKEKIEKMIRQFSTKVAAE
ncbi:MAG: ADP-ribosylglycohydrolase family protein [Chitinivibrionales bacterium]|nr:ADP-ribosylglycohydrolase family protein [Chitinivibrionales bacterium]